MCIYPGLQGLPGIDESSWMTAQDQQQLAVLAVTRPDGESSTAENVVLKRRRGGGGARGRVYFVLPMHVSAIVTGRPFELEWGGKQRPDFGCKSGLPWAITMRLLQGDDQLKLAPPMKAHKVGVAVWVHGPLVWIAWP